MIERALASRGLAGLLKEQYPKRRDCQYLLNWPFDGMHGHFPSPETSNPLILAFLRGLASIVKASIGTAGLAVKLLFRLQVCLCQSIAKVSVGIVRVACSACSLNVWALVISEFC